MHKLFRTYPIFLTNPTFLIPISQFHISSRTLAPNPKLQFVVNQVQELRSTNPANEFVSASDSDELSGLDCAVQISHPWREWVDLMELLLKRGYFEGDENPFRNGQVGPKESNRVRTACLNFSRDRASLLRLLSRKDVQIIAGYGCPSVDRKVVNSGKRLRAHVGIDEGDVCSSCNSRGDCERAYVKAREDEGGRTVDVMRFLLTHGIDPLTDTVGNKPSLNKKVKESVRRLLKEMVECSTEELENQTDLPKSMTLKSVEKSPKDAVLQEKYGVNVPMKQGDWICPKCNFLNFARNVKCLRCDGLFQERLAKLREDQDQDHLPLKKGDWICEKCNFLNFAKNSRCLQCKEKPPKRELNPGEWECESCNYINFRKNMLCLKCDHKRPKTCVEPMHEDGGYRKSNRVSFGDTDVNDRYYSGQGRNGHNRDAGRWRFVVEENDDFSHPNSSDKTSRFVDFPIAGGKIELSQNPQKRDKWKLKMLEKNKGGATDMASDDELRSSRTERRVLLSDSTDDEEMAEWFGYRKLATQRLPSRPN